MTTPFTEGAGTMPQFQIEGEAEVFEDAEEIDIQGDLALSKLERWPICF